MTKPHTIGPRGRSTVIYGADGRIVAAARDPYVDQIAALPLLLALAQRIQSDGGHGYAVHEMARAALDVARTT